MYVVISAVDDGDNWRFGWPDSVSSCTVIVHNGLGVVDGLGRTATAAG
jgi:hypothetical protein